MSAYRLIAAEQAHYPLSLLCRVLRVARSGWYAWRARPPSCRSLADAALTRTIRAVHASSRGTYGAPRVQVELADTHAIRCGRKRVARLMRAGVDPVSWTAHATPQMIVLGTSRLRTEKG